MRKILAFIIAPLTPAILIIGISVILSQAWPFNDTDYKIIITVSAIVSYISLTVFGIPIVYVLNKNKKLNLINISLAGIVAGMIVFSIYAKLLGFSLGSTSTLSIGNFTWGAVLGLCVALTYGGIAGITIRSKATPKSGAL